MEDVTSIDCPLPAETIHVHILGAVGHGTHYPWCSDVLVRILREWRLLVQEALEPLGVIQDGGQHRTRTTDLVGSHLLKRDVLLSLPVPVITRCDGPGLLRIFRAEGGRDHVERFPDLLLEHLTQTLPLESLDDVGQHHVHDVAVHELGARLAGDFKVPQVANDISGPQLVPLFVFSVIRHVVTGHTCAMAHGIFKIKILGHPIILEDKVVADNRGYLGRPSFGQSRVLLLGDDVS